MTMITRYTPVATLTAAVFSLMVFSPASALEVAQAQEAQPTQGQTGGNSAAPAVSDQKIQAFAVAYLKVDKVRQEYSAKIGATPDETAKQKLETEAKNQMVEAVKTSPDISVEEYTSILTAAQNDPALAQKLRDKIDNSAPAQQ
ncbi:MULTISPECIES: DUF4168 domain-containing protein [unclassified Sinorhizobium]|uniref:DUF4168 domain-containing protein n=1 Tax=unclassified Sinorhizobium TaxID=2613772 RepID=UPI0035240F2F